MRLRLFFFCVGLAFGIGCASTASTVQRVPRPSGEIGPSYNGKARVLVYRPYKYAGSGVGFDLKANDKFIGTVGPDGYLYWECEPEFITLELKFVDAIGFSLSCWRQFHAKENQLSVFEANFEANLLEAMQIQLLQLTAENRKKLLSELKHRKK